MNLERYEIEKKDLLMPASILIGAILISASILFVNVGKVSWPKIESDNVKNDSAQVADNKPSKITERKDAPKIGSGKVEVVEFADFQCFFCQKFFGEAYKEIKSKYIDTGKITLVYRHFPIPSHQNASKAAEAAECANKQGKFGAYYDTLFINGKPDGTGLDVLSLKKYAKNLGLDENGFNRCLDNGETSSIVQKDLTDGQKAGVNGTPTFFINGEKIVGAQPFDVFKTAIEEALK